MGTFRPENLASRGHKTRGRSYKHRYRDDIVCPECGKNSIYRNESRNHITYKCLKRNCRYDWIKRKEKGVEN